MSDLLGITRLKAFYYIKVDQTDEFHHSNGVSTYFRRSPRVQISKFGWTCYTNIRLSSLLIFIFHLFTSIKSSFTKSLLYRTFKGLIVWGIAQHWAEKENTPFRQWTLCILKQEIIYLRPFIRVTSTFHSGITKFSLWRMKLVKENVNYINRYTGNRLVRSESKICVRYTFSF